MRVYIAGPMRMYKDWNFAAFNDAAHRWTEAGHHVFNPAALDNGMGYGPEKNREWQSEDGKQHLKHVLLVDVSCLLQADAIALLPHWQESRGSTFELAIAQFLGLLTYDAVSMLQLDIPHCPWNNKEIQSVLTQMARTLKTRHPFIVSEKISAPLGVRIVSPADQNPLPNCSYCGYRFGEHDEVIPTVSIRGPVTLCRLCYNEAENTVR